MRKQTLASFGLSFIFILTAILTVTVTPASAAGSNDYGTVITYDVPFDFYVGNDKLAAGKYEIQRVSETLFKIYSVANQKGVLVAAQMSTNDENKVKSAKLVFNRYGQHNFLRRLYLQSRANGRHLNESKTERQVRNERESDENLAMKSEIIEIKAE